MEDRVTTTALELSEVRRRVEESLALLQQLGNDRASGNRPSSPSTLSR